MRPSRQLVTRRDFMRKLCQAGLTYKEASTAYSSMIVLLQESLLSGHRIKFGDIGSLCPVVRPPRSIVMGVKRVNGGTYVHSKRVFHLGERVNYRFNFFKEFARKHELR